MTTQYYKVAGHLFGMETEEKHFQLLPNYAPFRTEPIGEEPLFLIRASEKPIPSFEGWEHVYTDSTDADMPRIEMYCREGEWLFAVSMSREGGIVSAMVCSEDWREVSLYLRPQEARFAMDNAAMLVFAFATADKRTLLFHSSVTVRGGKGYMFLGHSGTGKSTHSQQWRAAFEDATLLNDDNPAVRIDGAGQVTVYGTPWSGKTPCYKNESVPVAALVQLAQAPHNEITKLRMTQAYPYILSSVSGLKIRPEMMDRLYETIVQLLETTPVYRLECLPNPDAARLCAQTCSL